MGSLLTVLFRFPTVGEITVPTDSAFDEGSFADVAVETKHAKVIRVHIKTDESGWVCPVSAVLAYMIIYVVLVLLAPSFSG